MYVIEKDNAGCCHPSLATDVHAIRGAFHDDKTVTLLGYEENIAQRHGSLLKKVTVVVLCIRRIYLHLYCTCPMMHRDFSEAPHLRSSMLLVSQLNTANEEGKNVQPNGTTLRLTFKTNEKNDFDDVWV